MVRDQFEFTTVEDPTRAGLGSEQLGGDFSLFLAFLARLHSPGRFLEIVLLFPHPFHHPGATIGCWDSFLAVITVCLHSGLTYGPFRRLAPPSSFA